MGGGGEPRRSDKIGEHGWRKGSGEGVLVIRKRGERHSILQSVMEIFRLIMSNFFEYGHHEFELVLRHDNGGRKVWLFSLSFGAALGVTRPGGNGPLSAGTFSACLFVVLVQPLLIAFVHVVNETIVEPVGDGLFDGARPTKVCAWVLPVVGWIEPVVVVYETVRIRGGNVRDWSLFLLIATGSDRPWALMPLGGSGEHSLEMVLLKRKKTYVSKPRIGFSRAAANQRETRGALEG